MYGNVNVDYKPCKTAVQLQKAADYMPGRLPEQIRDGVVKTAPNLYLGIYSESMNSEMARLNESTSHNLNLQEMYAKTVENVTNLAVGNIYYNLKKQEKEAINELMQYVEANSNQMEKDITACTENVKSATTAAEKASKKIAKSLERFRRVKTFRDLLYYASPVLVVIDIILRVVALVAHSQ